MGDSLLSNNPQERARQVKTIRQIARGETPDKRIFLPMEDLEEKQARQEQIKQEREERNERSDALREARMPWFCPNCKKIMKTRLDDKMYRLFNHCFDCQVDFENKLRIEGKYEEWEKTKVLKNKLSWIDEQIKSVSNWEEEATKQPNFLQQVGVNSVEIEKEKWNVDTKKIKTMATEAIEEYEKMKVETEAELESINI